MVSTLTTSEPPVVAGSALDDESGQSISTRKKDLAFLEFFGSCMTRDFKIRLATRRNSGPNRIHSAVDRLHLFLSEDFIGIEPSFPFSLHFRHNGRRDRARRLSVFLHFPLACVWYLCRNIGSRNFIIRECNYEVVAWSGVYRSRNELCRYNLSVITKFEGSRTVGFALRKFNGNRRATQLSLCVWLPGYLRWPT